jgi:hypothetical protein
MTLTILPQAAIEGLKSQLTTGSSLGLYADAGPDLKPYAPLASSIAVAEVPSLLMTGTTKQQMAATDLDNAIHLHMWLGSLPETVASDQRLWITLTHREFFAYTKWRWPVQLVEGDAAKTAAAERHVIAHWFFKGAGLAAMRRNAVARLWWAAHLTCAPWEKDDQLQSFTNEDRYFFTRVLLSNQDIYQGLIEREFAVNRRILTALLALIARDVPGRANSPFITKLLVRLNLMARFRELTAIPATTLIDELDAQLVLNGLSWTSCG